jgi:hypothetical protein
MSVAALPVAPTLPRRRGAVIDFTRQQPLGAISFVIIVIMMFAGIFSRYVAPYDPLDIDFGSILGPPSWEHWGGTDAFGRDIFSRIIWGSRTALVIGFTSSFIGSTIGAILGIASAYFGGRIDAWIQRFVDILLAFPIIVLALVVVAALRKSVLFGIDMNLIYAIAIPIVPRVARVVRAAALSIRAMPYVDAAPHGAECRRALSHHVHGLHRPGDPARGLALLPRPRRHRADAGLGPDALGQCGRLLSRGALDDPVPGSRDQPCSVRLQPVRRQPARLSRPAFQDVSLVRVRKRICRDVMPTSESEHECL